MGGEHFTGTFRAGQFVPDDPVRYAARCARFDRQRVYAHYQRPRSKATVNQHGYYRVTVLPTVAEWCGYDPKDKDEKDLVHEALKRKFFGVEERHGLEVVKSHADVDVEEMKDFLDWVLRMAAEGGCYVPEPHEVTDA